MLHRKPLSPAPTSIGNGAQKIVGTGERDGRSSRFPQNQTQEIRGELRGSDEAGALGLAARGNAPVLGLCRLLIAAGCDPGRPLHVYRADMVCLRIRSIGEGARLTVKATGTGCPMFVLEGSYDGAAGPPVRETGGAAIPHPHAAAECLR